uniref:1-phosphatidylinositol 4,5-bisphosphate phosphodiesterase delta-4-like isoform X2 n=1 Tax=Myxine glutinosa TaxID=7769 RepID=UPI00358E8B70
MSSDEQGSPVDDNLRVMRAGTVMQKVKVNGWKKERNMMLQQDLSTIRLQSNRFTKSETIYPIPEIEAIREGHQSTALRTVAAEHPAERCFTLAFGGSRKNLDLVASSSREAQIWVCGLKKLMDKYQNQNHQERLDQWIYEMAHKADKDKNGKMTLKEVKSLLKLMNTSVSDEYVEKLFQSSDMSNSGILEEEEFVILYKKLTERQDVHKLFRRFLSKDENIMSPQNFERFLHDEQHETSTSVDIASSLMRRYEPSAAAKAKCSFTVDGFLMYLLSEECRVFDPSMENLCQDMRRPLAHYFISSSHNTYLMEDQLYGPSSTEAYIRALQNGCRCVELDCWDGPDGEPVIYHGYTMTSKILFRDVIKAVNQYAFEASKYPVILSIENHCSLEQQQAMALHMRSILGEKLFTAPLGGKVPTQLPSPEELKGRILLKGKKLGGLEDSAEREEGEVSSEDEAADMDEAKEKGQVKKSNQKLHKDLSDLIIYCKSVHFNGFAQAAERSKCCEMSSFVESKAQKLCSESGKEFVRYNALQLSRIYPAGLRTDSSNYNPQNMWNAGCQIVALNFQTPGREMDLNGGRFRQNGGCGYVLKPTYMHRMESNFHPEDPCSGEAFDPMKLTIKIVSGQQLPKCKGNKKGSIIDPQVTVEVFGVPEDNQEKQTSFIENNGFNPFWNEILEFNVKVPSLAMVRFLVEDYDKHFNNDFIGQYSLPLTALKQGYRHVSLLAKDGNSLAPAFLFVCTTLVKKSSAQPGDQTMQN